MRTGFRAKRLTTDALLIAAALILSYIESIVPLNLLIPIPGFKLGLANIAVMFAVYNVGMPDGIVVSILRILLNSILFGSISTFWFSFVGAVFSLALLAFFKYYVRHDISFIGISVGCAAAHNLGQLTAAAVLFNDMTVINYLPWLLLMSVMTGVLTGIVMVILSGKLVKILPLLAVTMMFTSCGTAQIYSDYQIFAMDTIITFHVASKGETLFDECENLIKAYDKYSGKPEALMSKAEEMQSETDGAFDPYLCELVKLWNIPNNDSYVPSKSEITEAISTGGIDLGGIAKGYACEEVIEYFKSNGVPYGFVSFGGNIGVFGTKPDNSKWIIGVKDPRNNADVIGYLKIDEGYISVSGDYERFFIKNGIRYHHIFNPESGYPVRNGIQSVAVWSENGAEADALSTALFVMGTEKGLKFYSDSQYTFEAVFVTDDGLVMTEGMKNIFEIK